MEQARGTALRLWHALTWVQRFSIFGVGVASVLAVTGIALWASTPSYGVLFSGLAAQDAAAIVTQLGQDKIPYQLSSDSATIMVPTDSVARERLKLAAAGLPQGGTVGLEVFDKQGLFPGDAMTEQVNYIRGLEGELTRTIEQIVGVTSARVHIVIPPTDLFKDQQQSPTASVLLRLAPGTTLSADEVGGVQHLVASAVQGLKPDGVTVVDGGGNILSQSGGSLSTVGMTAISAQQTYARTVEVQLEALLDTVLGPNRAVVQVNDTMDWTQQETTSNTTAPQSRTSPIQSVHTQLYQTTGPASAVGGVAGINSNVPTYGITQSRSTAYQTQQSVTDTTYATSSTISHIVAAPGRVTQLSVAVMVNGITNTAELATLRQAIGTAAGLNPRRGDQLTVTSLPFDTSATTAATAMAAATQQQAFILALAKWIALLVVPLILLFLLRRLLRTTRPAPGVLSVTEADPARLGTAVLPLLPKPAATPEQERRDRMQKDIIGMARENPQEVAALISSWVDEGRTA